MSNPSVNIPDLGEIQFYDHYLPGLEAGTYQISVEHAVAVQNADTYKVEQTVIVRAPQFSLPPGLVQATYPAAGTQGQFSHVLPHVILSDRQLPWERSLRGLPKGTPWLALLIFDENELLPGDLNSNARTTTRTVSDLLAPDPLVLKPDLRQIASEDLQQTCNTIDLSSDLFRAVVPLHIDLPYLAHCRLVSTANQADGDGPEDGQFSAIVANRFPAAPIPGLANSVRNLAHLVSLEGYEAYLDGQTPFPKKTVRMVSLASWFFICQADDLQTFMALARALTQQSRLFRLPVALPEAPLGNDPATLVRQRLADGYVALSYHTRTGQDTFAWYRGPFAPLLSEVVEKTGPYTSSSAAIIFDQATGVFDLSLAAAWQIGRSLALKDATFARHLLAFRRTGHALIDLLIERLHSDHLDTPADLQELMGQNLIEQKFLDLLRADLPGRVQRQARTMPTPRRPRMAESPTDPVQELRDLLALPEIGALLAQAMQDDLKPIALWLARLTLLYAVPFDHLVPNLDLLPAESIRFFYLDFNWLGALVEGALSAGVQTSRDTLYQGLLKDTLQQAAQVEMQGLRARTRGVDTGQPTIDKIEAMSGILLRSTLVYAWPGLTVAASQHGQLLKILRMDRLSPDVLLCLFLGVPDIVTFSEPQQGLRFGVDDAWSVELRGLTPPVGNPTGGLVDTRNYRRANASRVLAVNALAGNLGQTLGQSLSSADFAIQMVLQPEQISFVIGNQHTPGTQ
jgi:hypothetical protein